MASRRRGIDFFPEAGVTSQLFVKDTIIHGTKRGRNLGPARRRHLPPTPRSTMCASNETCSGSRASRARTWSSGTASRGVEHEQRVHRSNSGGGPVDVTIENSVSTGNGLNGALSTNPNATVRLSNVTITTTAGGVLPGRRGHPVLHEQSGSRETRQTERRRPRSASSSLAPQTRTRARAARARHARERPARSPARRPSWKDPSARGRAAAKRGRPEERERRPEEREARPFRGPGPARTRR